MVPGEGLEPSRPKRATDFKSVVSANSTIPAFVNAEYIKDRGHYKGIMVNPYWYECLYAVSKY